MIDLLVDMIPKTHQLLVRLPPAMSVTLDGLKNRSKILLEYPGMSHDRNLKNITKTELGISDDDHIIDTLFHADVVIAVTTTLLLDAVLCDRPTIVVDFRGCNGKWESGAPSDVLLYSHMQPLLKSGGVAVVQSPEALSSAIQAYIRDPSIHHDGRMRVRRDVAYDGRASDRLVKVVRDALQG
jgi:CDP-glycerol glycerophosphotransferase (TagB/SpsB family)